VRWSRRATWGGRWERSRPTGRRSACPSTPRTAFILGWTKGDPTGDTVQGPFRDAGQDLLYLDLQRTGTGYDVRAQSLVCGFQNPIDTEIWNGRLYVLEFGGGGTVWETTTPPAEPAGRRPCTNVPR